MAFIGRGARQDPTFETGLDFTCDTYTYIARDVADLEVEVLSSGKIIWGR